MVPTADAQVRHFRFERDTLTFANELIWQYRFDPETGAMAVSRNNPPPTYSHRCFVLIKAARQFFYHARFEPGMPVAQTGVYRGLIRRVLSRNPRRASSPAEHIAIPGYDCLRAFSQANEPLLKAECGGPLQSYFLRSHWRMVFPVWRKHQAQMAWQLRQAVCEGSAPMVHLFRFPKVTINHGILLFNVSESEQELRFDAYDPNIPDRPVKLLYDKARRAFDFSPACYWAGGTVSVIQIFRGGFY